MEAEPNIVSIDQHRVWIEEPYALVVELRGDISGEHLRRMRELLDYIGDGNGPIIIMQNLSNGGAFTGAARKEILDDRRTDRVQTVICIGASFQMRVFMGMISKALKFVRPSAPLIVFVQDENEGRKILASERSRLSRESS